jgi:hypothetical protein
MRWLLLPLLLLLSGASAKPHCNVSDFYGLSWLGNPTERHQRLSQWLTTNGENCTPEQLLTIWNNLAMWAGAADSAELRGKILYYYELAMQRK